MYAAAAEQEVAKRAGLHSITKQMGTFKFFATTFFLSDAIGLLGILSKCLQVKGITYGASKEMVDSTSIALQALAHTPGPYLETFMNEVGEAASETEYIHYKDQELKDTVKEREKFTDIRRKFLEELQERLETTFPDSDAMEDFRIFTPAFKEMDKKPGTQL